MVVLSCVSSVISNQRARDILLLFSPRIIKICYQPTFAVTSKQQTSAWSSKTPVLDIYSYTPIHLIICQLLPFKIYFSPMIPTYPFPFLVRQFSIMNQLCALSPTTSHNRERASVSQLGHPPTLLLDSYFFKNILKVLCLLHSISSVLPI